MSADGRMLEAVVTVDDPGAFNEPLHMVQRWRKVKNQMAGDGLRREQWRSFQQEPVPDPAVPTSRISERAGARFSWSVLQRESTHH